MKNIKVIRKIVISIVILTLAMIVTLVIVAKLNVGTVKITVTPAAATVVIDGKETKATSVKLKPGKHTIVAGLNGYLQQQKTVVLTAHTTKVVRIDLEANNTSNLAKQALLDSDLYKNNPIGQNFYTSKAKEFYNGTWIIATVQAKGTTDLAVIIVKKDLTTDKYGLYIGPTPLIDQNVTGSLPPDLQYSLSHDGWLESPACCNEP